MSDGQRCNTVSRQASSWPLCCALITSCRLSKHAMLCLAAIPHAVLELLFQIVDLLLQAFFVLALHAQNLKSCIPVTIMRNVAERLNVSDAARPLPLSRSHAPGHPAACRLRARRCHARDSAADL
eukprot:366062-Chlamydomonas_euryale.AAC.13